MALMMIAFLKALASLLLFVQAGPDGENAQTDPAPVQGVRVVELFTSQGCPMCPGANEMLGEIIAEDPHVVALAYGVSYWDVYGWRDTFATEAFVERQQAYVDAGEAHRVYTPHFVINGGPEKVRFSRDRVVAALAGASALPVLIEMRRGEGGVSVRIDGPMRETPAQVWAVTYHPGVETRLIEDGPNAGREMVHHNMARAIAPVAEWAGGPLEAVIGAPGDGLAAAVLIQDGPGGRILSAARVP